MDSQACTTCGHAHFPDFTEMMLYDERRDECCSPGCDCEHYEAPSVINLRVYKCSACHRMVTRIWRSHVGGQTCDECHGDN